MKLWQKNKRKWLIHVLKILKDICNNSICMLLLSHGHYKVKYDTKTRSHQPSESNLCCWYSYPQSAQLGVKE